VYENIRIVVRNRRCVVALVSVHRFKRPHNKALFASPERILVGQRLFCEQLRKNGKHIFLSRRRDTPQTFDQP
jgi:hypothetical protein